MLFSRSNRILKRHKAVSRELTNEGQQKLFQVELDFAEKELGDLLMRVSRRSLPLSMLKDAIVSYGEQLSSRLLAEVFKAKDLNARQMDSRRLIVTDDEYGAATPIWDETEKLIKLELAKFDRSGRNSRSRRFYRGESRRRNDCSRSRRFGLFGGSRRRGFRAREIQIWTDVTGVLTCDPRICPEAKTLKTLSYEEAAELAYFGAKVLHPKTIKPAVDYRIPVRVCNSHEPEKRGTMILAETEKIPNTIKSIAHKTGITILANFIGANARRVRFYVRAFSNLRTLPHGH